MIWRTEISTVPEVSTIWRKLTLPKWPKYAPLTTKIAIFRDTRWTLGQAPQNPVKTLKRKFLPKKLISITDIEIFRNRYHHFPLTFTYIFKIRPILGSQIWIGFHLWPCRRKAGFHRISRLVNEKSLFLQFSLYETDTWVIYTVEVWLSQNVNKNVV